MRETASGLAQHGRSRLRSFPATAADFYACYGFLLLYKATLLHDQGVDYAPYGLAAGKALLPAKFVLIGDKLQLGAQIRGRRSLIYFIMRKSTLFFLLMIALSVVEEAIVGALHGRSVRDTSPPMTACAAARRGDRI